MDRQGDRRVTCPVSFHATPPAQITRPQAEDLARYATAAATADRTVIPRGVCLDCVTKILAEIPRSHP
jgi:hypothetical protein